MDVFVTRQPIFDRFEQVFGYELLFRSALSSYFRHEQTDEDSLRIVADAFFRIGIDTVTRGKRVLIDFTRDTLINGYPTILSNEQVVVGLAPSIEPDEPLVAACRQLKADGYQLAADYGFLKAKPSPLVDMVDLVSVNFRTVEPDERKLLAKVFDPKVTRLIASGIEQDPTFVEAMAHGYEYFHGPFFCQPVVVSGTDVPASKLNCLKLLREINRPEMDLQAIEDTIKREVALSYKLLRYINSVGFGLRSQITTVSHALMMLGQNGVRKWTSLVVLSDLGTDAPDELLLLSVQRAQFCESVATRTPLRDRRQDLYLLGLFSMLDVIVKRPLESLLANLPIAEDVKLALQGEPNELRPIYDLALAYEQGAWDDLSRIAAALGLDEQELPQIFLQSIESGNSALSVAGEEGKSADRPAQAG